MLFEHTIIHEAATEQEQLLPRLCKAVFGLREDGQTSLMVWWASCDKGTAAKALGVVQQHITIRALTLAMDDISINLDGRMRDAVSVLNLLHQANCNRSEPFASPEEFQNDAINESFHAGEDYAIWKHMLNGTMHTLRADIAANAIAFCNYRFVLTLPTKVRLLAHSNKVQARDADRMDPDQMMRVLLGHRPTQFQIKVRRKNVVADAITMLGQYMHRDPKVLRKEFRVEFTGEEGLDYGGVRKEFFQLILRDLFNPDFGMFVLSEDTRLYWFNKDTLDSAEQFKLLGLLAGIALYNNVNLDMKFPQPVYKKLMLGHGLNAAETDVAYTLKDLAAVNPSLAQGLQQLLDYDGDDVKDVFMRTFSIDYEDALGVKHEHELIENGSKVDLTNENRQQYVDRYISYELHQAVEQPFEAFKAGFWLVCDGADTLQLFVADELEQLICGTQDLDFHALERITEYDGYPDGKETEVIKWFWELVHTFEPKEKLQLLAFSTGSDRVPIGGLEQIKFVIAKQVRAFDHAKLDLQT